MGESIGRRIAYLRQKNGWTQQSLADRMAMSRVAISHIEMDLTIPSERSITLMAGIFKLSPTELVAGTTYPKAKAERLPELTTIYTELELKYALLKNDTEWLAQLDDGRLKRKAIEQIMNKWQPFLENRDLEFHDEHETILLLKIRLVLKELNDQVKNYLA